MTKHMDCAYHRQSKSKEKSFSVLRSSNSQYIVKCEGPASVCKPVKSYYAQRHYSAAEKKDRERPLKIFLIIQSHCLLIFRLWFIHYLYVFRKHPHGNLLSDRIAYRILGEPFKTARFYAHLIVDSDENVGSHPLRQ